MEENVQNESNEKGRNIYEGTEINAANILKTA